ncbi:MAG TPA: hypothetical protein VLG16_00615 [Candidatus Saccharimonadales bacterium]|nr:hypothetical protein [Candidatus Saccharimonadales bacterium]
MKETHISEHAALRAGAILALSAGAVLLPAAIAEAAMASQPITIEQPAHDPYQPTQHTSHSVGVNAPFPAIYTHVRATDYRPYARDFAYSSSSVLNVPKKEVAGVVDAIDSPALFMGAKVTITGWASAEDNGTLPYAGMLTPSSANQELATKRGEEYMKTLAGEMGTTVQTGKNGVLETFKKDGVTVNLMPGQEQQLTEAQAKELDTFAHAHNYADARAMVVAYDADRTNAMVTKKLDETLAVWRKVDVQVEGSLPVPVVVSAPERFEEPIPEEPALAKEIIIKKVVHEGKGFAAGDFDGALTALGLALAVAGAVKPRSDNPKPSQLPKEVPVEPETTKEPDEGLLTVVA